MKVPSRTQVAKGGAVITLVTASLFAGVQLWESSGKVILTPYRDIAGIWTVCAGITGPDVVPGKTYTEAECEALEAREIIRHGQGVLACATGPMTQKRYEALALFAYNVGIDAACKSTAMKKLNAGDIQGGCDALLMWSKVKGNFVKGLHNRRLFEREWCLQ